MEVKGKVKKGKSVGELFSLGLGKKKKKGLQVCLSSGVFLISKHTSTYTPPPPPPLSSLRAEKYGIRKRWQ